MFYVAAWSGRVEKNASLDSPSRRCSCVKTDGGLTWDRPEGRMRTLRKQEPVEVSRNRPGWAPAAGEAGARRWTGCGSWWNQGALPSSSAGCDRPPAPVSPMGDTFHTSRVWFSGLILLKLFYSRVPRGQLIPLSPGHLFPLGHHPTSPPACKGSSP